MLHWAEKRRKEENEEIIITDAAGSFRPRLVATMEEGGLVGHLAGPGIVIASIIFWAAGSSLEPIALIIPEWSELTWVANHFAEKSASYFLQFLAWLVAFGVAIHILGYRIREFIPGFAIIFILSTLVLTFGSWECSEI